MFGLNPMELIICLGIFVLLFGSRKLPELGTGLGEAISNFKRSYRDGLAIDVTPADKIKAEAAKTETTPSQQNKPEN